MFIFTALRTAVVEIVGVYLQKLALEEEIVP
jgi:hypothetical protein